MVLSGRVRWSRPSFFFLGLRQQPCARRNESRSSKTHPFPLTSFFLISFLASSIFRHIYAGSRHHDKHHERTRGNYASSLCFWDLVCGTTIEEESGKEE